MNNGTVNFMPAEGFLKVRVSTARGAIPLQGAKVAVRGTTADNSGIIALLTTDSGGLTPTLALPAPAKADSESPGNIKPFSEYNLEISLDGYQTQYYYNLPIFATITSVQTADLVPLRENGHPDFGDPNDRSERFFNRENPNLLGS